MLIILLEIIFVALTIIGLADTAYLIKKRKQGEAPICPLRGDCKFVLNSKYNTIFGIHTDLIGLSYYVGIVLWIISLVVIPMLDQNNDIIAWSGAPQAILLLGMIYAPILATALAFLMTLRMLILQFFIIRKMCFWCLLSSLCTIGMTVIMATFILGVSTAMISN